MKSKILRVLEGGDILFIVPPFVTTKTPILGPHILQSIAQRQGYRAEILHLNLLLASIIGVERYESVSYAQPFRMLGERLFAGSAYGLPALGKSPELCLDPVRSVFGNGPAYPLEEFEYKYNNSTDFRLDDFFKIEETCSGFIREAAETIVSLKYKMVGCSANWEQNNSSVALFNRIKELSPGTVTLMGGSNCEGEMAEGIGSLTDAVDYIFSGEGETVFAEFLEKYSAGNLPSQRIIVGKPFNDLDNIPLPVYDGYVNQRKHFLGDDSAGEWAAGYETSRGCWWGKCHFCGLNGMDRVRFREKTAGKALTDLEELKRQYRGKSIIMTDKVLPASYQKELLPELGKDKDGSTIAYELRPHLSLKDLVHLKNAKVEVIKPGIESLATGLLKLMNKGISAGQNVFLLRNAASLDMYVDWNLLWGFPGDKAEHYRETLALLPLLRHCCPPTNFRHICIDRFSGYFREPGRFGIEDLRPWWVYSMVYPEKAEVNKLAYRFIGDYSCASHDHPELIGEIAKEATLWKQQWKRARLVMVPFMNFYMIYDKRDINGKSINHVVTFEKAKEIMTVRPYNKSGNLEWAVRNKLGVVLDSRYVPLVTAEPELLQAFEED
ncbi:MAG: RiPP maturation radical SAM protein 1 [bacterium]|nr:RiPP maturation radical SAM protein 1 [bacterium]